MTRFLLFFCIKGILRFAKNFFFPNISFVFFFVVQIIAKLKKGEAVDDEED